MEMLQSGIKGFKAGTAMAYDNLKEIAPPSAQKVSFIILLSHVSGASAQLTGMSNETIITPALIAGVSVATGVGLLLCGGAVAIYCTKCRASKEPEYLVADAASTERLLTRSDYSYADADDEEFSAPRTSQNSPVSPESVAKDYF